MKKQKFIFIIICSLFLFVSIFHFMSFLSFAQSWNKSKFILFNKDKENKYTISYETYNGKNNKKNPVAFLINENVILYEPELKGYEFQGWYEDSSFRKSVNNNTFKVNENKRLYAKWIIKQTSYCVEYYLFNSLKNEYILNKINTFVDFTDSFVKTNIINFNNYVYNREISNINGYVSAEKILILRLYYDHTNTIQDEWNVLSLQDKENYIILLKEKLCIELDVKNIPKIGFISDKNDLYAEFKPKNNSIIINTNKMSDIIEVIDTIAHELRHCWQFEHAKNPITEQDHLFKENLKNYKTLSKGDTYEEYKNQIIEKDAEEFAKNYVIQYLKK